MCVCCEHDGMFCTHNLIYILKLGINKLYKSFEEVDHTVVVRQILDCCLLIWLAMLSEFVVVCQLNMPQTGC